MIASKYEFRQISVESRKPDMMGHCLCVVWPPCLAILCYMSGDVGHVCACVKGSVSLGEGVVG